MSDYVTLNSDVNLSVRRMNIIVNGLEELLRSNNELSHHARECYDEVVKYIRSKREELLNENTK